MPSGRVHRRSSRTRRDASRRWRPAVAVCLPPSVFQNRELFHHSSPPVTVASGQVAADVRISCCRRNPPASSTMSMSAVAPAVVACRVRLGLSRCASRFPPDKSARGKPRYTGRRPKHHSARGRSVRVRPHWRRVITAWWRPTRPSSTDSSQFGAGRRDLSRTIAALFAAAAVIDAAAVRHRGNRLRATAVMVRARNESPAILSGCQQAVAKRDAARGLRCIRH